MRVAALWLVAGCWNVSQPGPVAPGAPSGGVTIDAPAGVPVGASSRPTNQRRERFPLHSVWEGTYICAQGLSSVRLTIDAMRNGSAIARYDFGPVPSNPIVPDGAYSLKGELEPTGGGGFTGKFKEDEWINKPANYFMVALSIESGDGKTMTGTIHHGSCSDFKTTRIN